MSRRLWKAVEPEVSRIRVEKTKRERGEGRKRKESKGKNNKGGRRVGNIE